MERLVVGDTTHGGATESPSRSVALTSFTGTNWWFDATVLPCALGRRITAALAAGQDRETLPAVAAVDAAAQPNPRTRCRPQPAR
jgi:hypothetical protein